MIRGIVKDPERTLTSFLIKNHEPLYENTALIRTKVDASLSICSAGLSAGLEYLMRTDLRDLLDSINMPSVIFHGKEDAVISWRSGRFLAANIRNSSFKLLDGVGHDIPVSSPELIIEEVKNNLKTIN
jgi:pimeloyl-ACP methyl ester carboxylesterase